MNWWVRGGEGRPGVIRPVPKINRDQPSSSEEFGGAYRVSGLGWWAKDGRGEEGKSNTLTIRFVPLQLAGYPIKPSSICSKPAVYSTLVRLPQVSSLKFTLSLWEARNVGGISVRSKLRAESLRGWIGRARGKRRGGGEKRMRDNGRNVILCHPLFRFFRVAKD